jgi:hypothetical protein
MIDNATLRRTFGGGVFQLAVNAILAAEEPHR